MHRPFLTRNAIHGMHRINVLSVHHSRALYRDGEIYHYRKYLYLPVIPTGLPLIWRQNTH